MSKMTWYKYILNYMGLHMGFTFPVEVIEDGWSCRWFLLSGPHVSRGHQLVCSWMGNGLLAETYRQLPWKNLRHWRVWQWPWGDLCAGLRSRGYVYLLNKLWCASVGLRSSQGWIHVAVTRRPCGVRLYINGQLVAKNTSPSNPPVPVSNMPRFVLWAGSVHGNKCKMTLDESHVLDTVMSDKDVSDLYTMDARLNWYISHWYIKFFNAVHNGQLL